MDKKKCTKCEQEKSSVNEFYKRTTAGYSGYLSWCKNCMREFDKTKERREYKKKYLNERYFSDGGKEYMRDWYKTPKGKAYILRRDRKRRKLKKLLPDELTVSQWKQIKKDQNNRCAICGENKQLFRDHIIPLSKGGRLTKENTQGLCNSCNARKSDKILENYQVYEVMK